MTQDEMMRLVLQLASLAAGPAEKKDLSQMEVLTRIAEDQDAFLAGIRPYEGWTAEQIMAAKP